MSKEELLIKIIEEQQIYIDILGSELNEMFPFAYSHAWRSSRVEEGEKQRQKIQELKDKLMDL